MSGSGHYEQYTQPGDALPGWTRLRDALLDISRIEDDEAGVSMTRLLSASARALEVARVSYWRIAPDRSSIQRVLMYTIAEGWDRSVVSLTAAQAPRYFEALDKTLTLAAENVLSDERTGELVDDYLAPAGIGAMLDVVVRRGGHLVGVVCHEHVGGAREWNAEERMFAAAIAALVAQQLEHAERSQIEAERRRALLSDRLTGLPNRAGLLERLSEWLAVREHMPAALVLVDIDHFHRINHAFGAEVGDQVLIAIAERLRGLTQDPQLARLGNDQFAIVCVGHGPKGAADDLLARVDLIRAALQAPLEIGSRRLDLTVSIGVVADLSAYRHAEPALRDAMIAVDTASRGPRGNLVLFDSAIRDRVARRMELERDLRRAAAAREFELHLQPVLRVTDATLAGAEALLRWRHPERGLLLPGEFVDVAEEAGLLTAIYAASLSGLLEECGAWFADRDSAPLRLNLNVAASQLRDLDFPELIERLCRRAGLSPSVLRLEITENVLLEGSTEVERGLRTLREHGVELSLDDFGTGHASLRHLISLPLAEVKLDRSFIVRLGTEARAAEIVRGMIAMAHALGLETVAEGVETETQRRMLEDMGCDWMQGFAFDSALPPATFAAHWLPRLSRAPAPGPQRRSRGA